MSTLELHPESGSLSARVFENEGLGIPPTLFFDIELPLAPFDFEGERQQTAVRLEFIDFGVGDWRELAEREFLFPVNPEDGYIDGSVYLGGVHNPADVTRIRFGPIEEGRATAVVELTIDFTFEGPEELGIVAHEWSVDLAFDPIALDEAVREARRQGAL